MRGDKLKEFRSDDREVDMRLAFRADDRQTLEDLAATPLYLPNGERSSLGAVATFHIAKTARTIDRVDRLTSVTIEGIVAKDSTLGEVKKGVEAAMEAFPLPAGVSWAFGRSVEENDETAQDMSINILLAIVLIFFVMASLFESAAVPGVDHHLDHLRHRRRVLGPGLQRHTADLHGHARHHDPDRCHREHRHRADCPCH